MDFGEAIKALKEGKRVARTGWNGKSQYIELATNISYINADSECINVNHNSIGSKAIAFVGTSGVQLGWLASQADMLAEDWKIIEKESLKMKAEEFEKDFPHVRLTENSGIFINGKKIEGVRNLLIKPAFRDFCHTITIEFDTPYLELENGELPIRKQN